MNFDNLLKINNPSGRLEFFKYSICIAVLQLIFALVFLFLTSNVLGAKSIIWLPPFFVILFELPLLYLYFIQSAKRLWDITGNRNSAIMVNIFVFIISVIGMISFAPLALIIYLVLILCQGKIIKNV
jgi:uncharacterized membrane protein YhaH (DUF805 family)